MAQSGPLGNRLGQRRGGGDPPVSRMLGHVARRLHRAPSQAQRGAPVGIDGRRRGGALVVGARVFGQAARGSWCPTPATCSSSSPSSNDSVSRRGWPGVRGIATAGLARMYRDGKRMDQPELVDRLARTGRCIRSKLEDTPNGVVMSARLCMCNPRHGEHFRPGTGFTLPGCLKRAGRPAWTGGGSCGSL